MTSEEVINLLITLGLMFGIYAVCHIALRIMLWAVYWICFLVEYGFKIGFRGSTIGTLRAWRKLWYPVDKELY